MSRANGITRQEILTAIKWNGSMTAEELARELTISQVAVRQHLASLEAENMISISVDRKGLGRPSHRYRLTSYGDETFPRRYEGFSAALLRELGEWQGEEAIEALFARLREQGVQRLQHRTAGKTLGEKVKELARIQTEFGFMAEAAGDEDGEWRIVQHNCSLCAVASHYPKACCRNEMQMLEQLLGDVDIQREKYILAGDNTCTYRIQEGQGT